MKKILSIIFSCLFFAATYGQDSYGTDFWIAVPGNSGTPSPELYITAQAASSVTITVPGLSYSNTVAIAAGTLQTIVLPSSTQITASGISSLGVHIVATTDVTVYLMNARSASTDAYMALPVDALGTDYYVMGYDPDNAFSIPAQLTVVATQNNTTVTINPKSPNSESLPVGSNSTVLLQMGETYQIRSTVYTSAGDFTGSKVTADKPIAVFGGNQCTNISGSLRACDHLVEQMPPTTAWGVSFVTVPLATRTAGDVFRIMAQTNSTSVSINGSTVATLAAGDFYETILSSTSYNRIVASNPILVGQYSRSSQADGVTSDPFFALVPPDDQFLTDYIISSGTSNILGNYLNITSPNSNLANVQVDGVVVPPGSWSGITGTSFSGAKVPVSSGIHTVNSLLPVGVMAYGFGSFDSYGYLGGQSFSPVATVDSLKLDLAQVATFQAQEKCLQAKVLDQNNNPVVGVKVDFSIFGGNTAAGFGFTDPTGVITFCYNVCKSGTDTVVAAIASLTDTATIVVQPTTLTTQPTSANVNQGAQHCVTASVKDGGNVAVSGAVVSFNVIGVNSANGTINTDASGNSVFCYTATNTGKDTIIISAGCLDGHVDTVYAMIVSGAQCQFTNSFSDIWINPAYKAAGASDPHTYYWGLSYGVIAARPQNGVGPYTYQWSSSAGYTIKDDTQKRARLWYPTGPQWVKVEITDVGASCTATDSIYIDWVDFTCNQPSIWFYELCNVNTNVTSCVQGTVNMRNLVSTGDYVFGPCGSPKTNWGNQSSLFEVTLFPNPSNGQFAYELFSSTANNYSISIMDINGRVLYSENVDNTYSHVMKDLDLSHLAAGVYIFQVSDENNSAVKRFVIQ